MTLAATVQGLQEKLNKRAEALEHIGDEARASIYFQDAKLMREASLLLSACAGASAPQGWKTIETAPEIDLVLLWHEEYYNRPFVGYRMDTRWFDCDDMCELKSSPSYWMPLPAAPPLAQASSGGGTTVGEE